ncbi:MAG: hypothetical protein Barrevirus3_15 [Barrevirus sp.]|uniref:Uncharacterized protein n=1 Tax=Barrevirus sp. TaxID=2487763 RepID=A0A3G4ZPS5_9VIRU|nr:MAG: hypothetical protein Barrevirus3_15 [Barrevirus sp.]
MNNNDTIYIVIEKLPYLDLLNKGSLDLNNDIKVICVAKSYALAQRDLGSNRQVYGPYSVITDNDIKPYQSLTPPYLISSEPKYEFDNLTKPEPKYHSDFSFTYNIPNSTLFNFINNNSNDDYGIMPMDLTD